MGYTHYFEQSEEPEDAQWQALVADFKHMYASSLITTPLPIQRESDTPGLPHANKVAIIFNGIGEDGYETFCLPKKDFGFNFCKTANRPYDLVVVATLILVHHHMPHLYSIRSDGTRADWKDGQHLIKTLLGITLDIPPGIRD